MPSAISSSGLVAEPGGPAGREFVEAVLVFIRQAGGAMTVRLRPSMATGHSGFALFRCAISAFEFIHSSRWRCQQVRAGFGVFFAGATRV
jgi:hypothetical protein